MTDTEMILKAIAELKQEMNQKFDAVNERFDEMDEHFEEIETSIGMLAEWADDVAVITKVPFAKASGDSIVK